MKLSFSLSIIISLLIGCLSFGEETDFEINSKEGSEKDFSASSPKQDAEFRKAIYFDAS